MQDRFKSRFFHKPSGKYLNSQSLVYCNGCYEQVADRQLPNGTYQAYILATYNTFEIIEEQCAGLKDKNNRFFYEGDIVEYYDYICEVRFEKASFILWVLNGEEEGFFHFSDIADLKTLEVKGNIHDNLEIKEDVKKS